MGKLSLASSRKAAVSKNPPPLHKKMFRNDIHNNKKKKNAGENFAEQFSNALKLDTACRDDPQDGEGNREGGSAERTMPTSSDSATHVLNTNCCDNGMTSYNIMGFEALPTTTIGNDTNHNIVASSAEETLRLQNNHNVKAAITTTEVNHPAIVVPTGTIKPQLNRVRSDQQQQQIASWKNRLSLSPKNNKKTTDPQTQILDDTKQNLVETKENSKRNYNNSSSNDDPSNSTTAGGVVDDATALAMNFYDCCFEEFLKLPFKKSKPIKPYWQVANEPSSGRLYYFHRLTRETTWTKPEGFDKAWAKYLDNEESGLMAELLLLRTIQQQKEALQLNPLLQEPFIPTPPEGGMKKETEEDTHKRTRFRSFSPIPSQQKNQSGFQRARSVPQRALNSIRRKKQQSFTPKTLNLQSFNDESSADIYIKEQEEISSMGNDLALDDLATPISGQIPPTDSGSLAQETTRTSMPPLGSYKPSFTHGGDAYLFFKSVLGDLMRLRPVLQAPVSPNEHQKSANSSPAAVQQKEEETSETSMPPSPPPRKNTPISKEAKSDVSSTEHTIMVSSDSFTTKHRSFPKFPLPRPNSNGKSRSLVRKFPAFREKSPTSPPNTPVPDQIHENQSKPVWKSTLDVKTGEEYYYHRETKEVTWTKPEGFDEAWNTYLGSKLWTTYQRETKTFADIVKRGLAKLKPSPISIEKIETKSSDDCTEVILELQDPRSSSQNEKASLLSKVSTKSLTKKLLQKKKTTSPKKQLQVDTNILGTDEVEKLGPVTETDGVEAVLESSKGMGWNVGTSRGGGWVWPSISGAASPADKSPSKAATGSSVYVKEPIISKSNSNISSKSPTSLKATDESSLKLIAASEAMCELDELLGGLPQCIVGNQDEHETGAIETWLIPGKNDGAPSIFLPDCGATVPLKSKIEKQDTKLESAKETKLTAETKSDLTSAKETKPLLSAIKRKTRRRRKQKSSMQKMNEILTRIEEADARDEVGSEKKQESEEDRCQPQEETIEFSQDKDECCENDLGLLCSMTLSHDKDDDDEELKHAKVEPIATELEKSVSFQGNGSLQLYRQKSCISNTSSLEGKSKKSVGTATLKKVKSVLRVRRKVRTPNPLRSVTWKSDQDNNTVTTPLTIFHQQDHKSVATPVVNHSQSFLSASLPSMGLSTLFSLEEEEKRANEISNIGLISVPPSASECVSPPSQHVSIGLSTLLSMEEEEKRAKDIANMGEITFPNARDDMLVDALPSMKIVTSDITASEACEESTMMSGYTTNASVFSQEESLLDGTIAEESASSAGTAPLNALTARDLQVTDQPESNNAILKYAYFRPMDHFAAAVDAYNDKVDKACQGLQGRIQKL